MDAVELLTHQHRALEDLFNRLIEAGDDPERRRSLFASTADQLSVHIAAEEQLFYPAVVACRTEDVLLESLEEHLSLKRLMADLLEMDPSERTFEPKLKVLREQAEHHHGEEEEDLFPKVRRLIEPERLQALGDEMLALQQSMRQDGAPREAVAEQTDAAAPLAAQQPDKAPGR